MQRSNSADDINNYEEELKDQVDIGSLHQTNGENVGSDSDLDESRNLNDSELASNFNTTSRDTDIFYKPTGKQILLNQSNRDQLNDSLDQSNLSFQLGNHTFNNRFSDLESNINLNFTERQHGSDFQKSQLLFEEQEFKITDQRVFNNVLGSDAQLAISNLMGSFPVLQGRQSLWQKPKNENMFEINHWNELQEKLKEEYNLIMSESNQQSNLQGDLEESHKQYYRTYIELLELEETQKEIKVDENKKKVLIENTAQVFKDANSVICQILKTLAQNPKLLAQIIKTHGNNLDEPTKNLIRSIVNTFYDNIIEEEVWDQDIMIFISNIIKFEVEQAQDPSEIKFKSNQVLTKILNEFTKRQDFQRYTKYIFKGPLQYITKANKIVVNPQKIFELLKKKQTSQGTSIQQQIQRKTMGNNQKDMYVSYNSNQSMRTEPSISDNSNKNYAQKYEQILRQYDSVNSNKNNIVSHNVMKIVGLGEESKSARFQARQTIFSKPANLQISTTNVKESSNLTVSKADSIQMPLSARNYSSNQGKDAIQDFSGVIKRGPESGLDKESQMMQDNVNRLLKKNIDILKNLTNIVFDSIFKNLYNIPVPIRITCKIIEIVTKEKFQNISDEDLFTIIGYFLFDCYLIPQFMFSHHLRQVNLIKDEHEDNLFEIKKLMKNIYRREFFPEQDTINYKYFNPLIKDLSNSIEDYFKELLSINEEAVIKIINHESQKQEKMKVVCVCITLDNVQTLCQIIEKNYSEISKINQQIADYVKRVFIMNDSCHFFDDRKDLDIPGTHKPQQIYTIIIDITMPQELNTNYIKEYKRLYEVKKNMSTEEMVTNKAKNMIQQVLVSIEKLNNILSFTGYKNMELTELFKIFEDGYYLHNAKHSNNVDNVPIMIKAKYLLNILKQLPSKYQENNLMMLFAEMSSEFHERFQKFMKVSNHTKSELLKAKNTIKKYQSILKENIDLLNRDKKRRILYEFIEKQQLNLCITSQKTRAGLRKKPTKATNNGMNNSLTDDEEDSLIQISGTDCCVHTFSNLDFVIGLTQGASGDSSNQKKKEMFENQSHCKDIISFIDIFASLPEVQEVVTSGKEISAINSKFSQFMEELFDMVKFNPLFSQYSQEDQDWINDQLEKYITRKLYDQIFPKEKTYADTALYCRMKVLSWINYDHLEIEKVNRVDEMWDISAKALLNIDYVKSPSEKLDCLIESTTIMTNVLKLTQTSDNAASADSILPISIYILLKACPTRLWSNINFISAFCNKEKMLTQIGYCFAQIKLAVDFLANLTPKQVNVTDQQFHELIYEKEIQYGIYFLKKRPRAVRTSINRELVKKVLNDIEQRKSSKERDQQEKLVENNKNSKTLQNQLIHQTSQNSNTETNSLDPTKLSLVQSFEYQHPTNIEQKKSLERDSIKEDLKSDNSKESSANQSPIPQEQSGDMSTKFKNLQKQESTYAGKEELDEFQMNIEEEQLQQKQEKQQ
ncbi:GTPase-activator protein for Ras-like GTPase (macronuclear) [Tetrahymena thermophila SB210]|uniref:GTPase-activator protein for Ras-like GTPase n=1 Tax=Tetrahymena thermophila (strain SB210) TaxID=312017 RepID=Q23D35_TETTS|nr:GTPase-activator protein for Ras-like GTPase [Tetrahymena thermophila SB210]EAR94380.2 GTPase-activator protein for Ras-like GTPase [Tetrahymena thermophila SB210]|eukprot:XP_001014851.2 GTPase-activator protein for Ras-like GTPase [Tetrahymena thermophila SB210]